MSAAARHRKLFGQIMVRHIWATGLRSKPNPSAGWRNSAAEPPPPCRASGSGSRIPPVPPGAWARISIVTWSPGWSGRASSSSHPRVGWRPTTSCSTRGSEIRSSSTRGPWPRRSSAPRDGGGRTLPPRRRCTPLTRLRDERACEGDAGHRWIIGRHAGCVARKPSSSAVPPTRRTDSRCSPVSSAGRASFIPRFDGSTRFLR